MAQMDYVEEEIERLEVLDDEPPVLTFDSFSAPIERLLSKAALTIDANDSVDLAIAKLRETEFGAICVVRERRLVGLLTERDLLCHVVGVVEDYAAHRVSEVMLSNPIRLRSTDPILYALHNMQAEGYRHIPIVDEADEPISIVSIKDVIRYILGHFPDSTYNLTAEPYRGPVAREGA